MKKYVVMLAFMAFFLSNCSKESPNETLPLDSLISTQTSSRSGKGSTVDIDPQIREVYESHKEHYRDVDPFVHVSDKLREQLRLQFIQEVNRLEVLGIDAYLNVLINDRIISPEFGSVLQDMQSLIENFGPVTRENLPSLIQELDNFRQQISYVTGVGKEITILDNHIQATIANLEGIQDEFGDGQAIQRGDCPGAEAFADGLSTAYPFAVLGAVAAVTAASLAAMGLIAAGPYVAIALIPMLFGFSTGFITGLFSDLIDDGCADCNTPQGISIIYEESCNMTRTLNAFGSGDDPTAWEWNVSPSSDLSIVTTTITNGSQLEVTQSDPLDPLVVSARPICEDDVDFYTRTVDLSFSNGPLGSVGTLNVAPSEAGQTYDINEVVDFIMYSTNQSSGNVVFSMSAPSSIVHIEEQGDNYFTVGFHNTGTVTIVFTATNVCSGLTTTDSVTFTVTN